MRRALLALALAAVSGSGCARTTHPSGAAARDEATIAQVYFWRAKPGMADAYERYIREFAEPIDLEAQRAGAFLDVKTYAASDSTLPWTHMRVFLLRDSTQLRGLSAALTAAGEKLHPDSVARRKRGEYSASLRDRVGATVTQIIR